MMLFVLFDIVVGFVSKVKYYVLGLLVGGVVGFVLYQLRAGLEGASASDKSLSSRVFSKNKTAQRAERCTFKYVP
jgi:hypothetical protein